MLITYQSRTLHCPVLPVWQGKQPTTDVEYDYADGKREKVAVGYQKLVPQSAVIGEQVLAWTERRLIVRSLKVAHKQEMALRDRLAKAQLALSSLGETKRGKKRLCTLEDWQQASDEIIKHYRVQGLLQLNYKVKSETRSLRKYGKRPACVKEATSISLDITVDETALCEAINLLGWRVYVTNHPSETFSLLDGCGCLSRQLFDGKRFCQVKKFSFIFDSYVSSKRGPYQRIDSTFVNWLKSFDFIRMGC